MQTEYEMLEWISYPCVLPKRLARIFQKAFQDRNLTQHRKFLKCHPFCKCLGIVFETPLSLELVSAQFVRMAKDIK